MSRRLAEADPMTAAVAPFGGGCVPAEGWSPSVGTQHLPDAIVVDRDGRRARPYRRQDPTRPGQQLRRQMRAEGLAWCRGCRGWLPLGDVDRRGACQSCLNAEYRQNYAGRPEPIRLRSVARKRGVAPLPAFAAELLMEQFDGCCAYCPARATTWDHVVPIAAGGATVPGNVVPACRSCNSSKRDRDLVEWLNATGRTPNPMVLDVVILGEAA